MNANKQYPFENDALDARLRRRLTAEAPPLRDLWPAVAARLAAPPRRRHTRVAVLAAAAAAALLLMGAAALRGFVIHDWTTGETVELLPGEPYSGDGSDTAMEMHRLAETDPNWRDTIHDDRDEWPETWDKQYCTYDENGEVVSSGTPMLDFLNTAVYGQVLANVTGDARGSAACMDVAKWPADEEAALRQKLAGTGAALWLPQALPERYEFAHGSITPYFTPAQIEAAKATVKTGEENGEAWAAVLWDLPQEVQSQVNSVNLAYYGPEYQRVLVHTALTDSTRLVSTGNAGMETTKLDIAGFALAALETDQNDYYDCEEMTLTLYEPVEPVVTQHETALFGPLQAGAPEGSVLRSCGGWGEVEPQTMRYREYTLSLIGFSQVELDALVAELDAYGAAGSQK